MLSPTAATANTPVIAVVGSLNVDLVSRTTRVPDAGETLTATGFDIGHGGKGANQAVACARLSRTRKQAAAGAAGEVEVRMVGAVGDDQFADDFLEDLRRSGVNVEGVRKLEGRKTGVAVIIVEEASGQNRILFSPNANYDVEPTGLLQDDVDVVVFQLEMPLHVVLQQIKEAKEKGITVILNPAPAVPLPDDAYQGLDHLIVNETEAAILSGKSVEDITPGADLSEVAGIFIDKGVRHFLITLGSHGVFYQTEERHLLKQPGILLPAKKVKVVDTTAAGDTFVGTYAVAVARAAAGQQARTLHKKPVTSFPIDAAVKRAIAASALTVQSKGAQSAIPWLDQVPDS